MPEIPQNTGNIMRTCSATGSILHIIGPLPFKIDADSLKRSGMDYIQNLEYFYYENYDAFISTHPSADIYYVTRYGEKAPSMFKFDDSLHDYYLMFGRESTGIPKDILSSHLDHCMRLPMKPFARSLNLSNCVAIVVYEVLRQLDYLDLATRDFLKGEDYLK